MCCLLSNLLKASVLKMNELDKFLVELGDFGGDTIDPSFSIDAIVTDAQPPFPVPHFSFEEIDSLIEWLCAKLNIDYYGDTI